MQARYAVNVLVKRSAFPFQTRFPCPHEDTQNLQSEDVWHSYEPIPFCPSVFLASQALCPVHRSWTFWSKLPWQRKSKLCSQQPLVCLSTFSTCLLICDPALNDIKYPLPGVLSQNFWVPSTLPSSPTKTGEMATRTHQRWRCPVGPKQQDTAGRICLKHFWFFFLLSLLHQRIRKCPTIPKLEVIKQQLNRKKSGKYPTTTFPPGNEHMHLMLRAEIYATQCKQYSSFQRSVGVSWSTNLGTVTQQWLFCCFWN